MSIRSLIVAFFLFCLWIPLVQGGIDASLRLELESEKQGPSHYPWAQYRVAVFSFEDPEQTGLGDAVARILARRMLFESPVSSIAVVNYQEGLSPTKPGDLGYYDKVEKLTEQEEFILAVWGRILPLGDKLRLDAFIQISPKALGRSFARVLRLPRAMGRGTLQVRLRPDRFRVQQLDLPLKAALADIRDSAERLLELRPAPDAAALPIGLVPRDEGFSLVDRSGSWVKMRMTGGSSGWLSADALCRGHCRPLLEAADFAGGLLRFAQDGKPSNATDNLHTNALAVEEQLKAMAALDGTGERLKSDALPRIQRWIGPHRWTGRDKWTRIDRGSGSPPGGGAFYNLLALVQVQLALERESQNLEREIDPKLAQWAVCRACSDAAPGWEQREMACRVAEEELDQARTLYELQQWVIPGVVESIVDLWKTHNQRRRQEYQRKLTQAISQHLSPELPDTIRLSQEEVRAITMPLSRAALDNPTERELMHNLAILFNYLGEKERSKLAKGLERQLPKLDIRPQQPSDPRDHVLLR